MIFEKTKEHYMNGTQLYIAFREAQKESLFKILFLNAVVLIVGFICLFMPVASVQSFGWVALVLSLISTFTNLVLMRLFIKMYLAINNEDGKKCNFHKGGKNA
jgi:preprotein translocase subunit SecD